jgi:hypothetical protein
MPLWGKKNAGEARPKSIDLVLFKDIQFVLLFIIGAVALFTLFVFTSRDLSVWKM